MNISGSRSGIAEKFFKCDGEGWKKLFGQLM